MFMPVIPTFTNRYSRLPLLLALAVSIGLHVGLWVLNPSILLTGGRGFESPERVTSYPRLRLDRLQESRSRPEPADLEDRLHGLEGESADEFPIRPDLTDAEASFAVMETDRELLDEGLVISPLEPDRIPAGLEPIVDSWQSRPEILAIRERRIEERPEARPRQIIAREEADDPVVDILQPFEEGAVPAPGQIAGGFSEEELDAAARRVLPRPIPGGANAGDLIDSAPEGSLRDWRPALRPPGLSARLVDDDTFVYSPEAADQLLRITAQAYFDPSRPEYRYVKVQLRPSEFEELTVLPREVIFLLDASSRVTPEAFQQVTQAVGTVLGELSPEDRFNLYLLQSGVTQLFDESQAATPFNLARARGRLAQTRPQGRGDLFAGLNMLLASADAADRLRIGVVVTDGIPSLSIEESSTYIERFTRTNRGEMSVFTVGVGRQVNRYLLDFLSFRNRGDSLVTEQTVQIGEALRRTLRGIRRPLLRHLTYRFADGDRLWVYPESLTHLYMDRPLILVMRVPADQEALTFQVVGHSREGAHDMLYTMEVARIPPGPWSLRQDWAWQAVLNQVAEYLQTGDSATRERIRGLSRDYGISVPYALSP